MLVVDGEHRKWATCVCTPGEGLIFFLLSKLRILKKNGEVYLYLDSQNNKYYLIVEILVKLICLFMNTYLFK